MAPTGLRQERERRQEPLIELDVVPDMAVAAVAADTAATGQEPHRAADDVSQDDATAADAAAAAYDAGSLAAPGESAVAPAPQLHFAPDDDADDFTAARVLDSPAACIRMHACLRTKASPGLCIRVRPTPMRATLTATRVRRQVHRS